MSFKIDYSQADTMEGIQDGTYEAVFYMMNEDTNPNTGNDFIRIDLIVRNDIDQKFKNAHVFDQMYKARDTGKFSMKRLAWMASAAQLDQKKEYNSMDELCEDFVGHPVKITVKNSDEEYNGKVYHHTNITRLAKTDFPKLNHQWKDTPEKLKGQTKGTGTIDLSEADTTEVEPDSLPFQEVSNELFEDS